MEFLDADILKTFIIFLAHGLWTYAIFFNKKYKWKAVLFAFLPDIVAFAPFVIAGLFGLKSNPNAYPWYVI